MGFVVDSDVIDSGVGFVTIWDWKSDGICKQTDYLIPAQRKRSAVCVTPAGREDVKQSAHQLPFITP